MHPLNDLAMIQLADEEIFKDDTQKDTAESGILIELPDKFTYFGFWSFAFESSWMNKDKLTDLYSYWETKIGRKVFWTALSERGNIISKDGQRYALLKLTSLIAEDTPDSTAESVHSDGAGSFGLEQ